MRIILVLLYLFILSSIITLYNEIFLGNGYFFHASIQYLAQFIFRLQMAAPEEVGRFLAIYLIYRMTRTKWPQSLDWKFAFYCGAVFGFVERVMPAIMAIEKGSLYTLPLMAIAGILGHGLFTIGAYLGVTSRSWRLCLAMFVLCLGLHGAYNAAGDWVNVAGGYVGMAPRPTSYYVIVWPIRFLILTGLAAILWRVAKLSGLAMLDGARTATN